jgi:peptidoglycan/xylan/chitin deacetylase (PgdA/CDA1 family)
MNHLFKIIKKTKTMVLRPKHLGTIYMLHRCAPINQGNFYWNEHMKVSPKYLKTFLNKYKRTHEFINLDDFYLLTTTRKKPKKPFIVMTFDDGYRDNYEYALPVFDELKIPFAVYITNSFPDKTAFLWWYVLEHIIQNNNRLVLSNGNKFICDAKDKKEELFLHLRALILKLNQEKLEEEFNTLFYDYLFDYTSYNEELCLSWDMVKEMSNNVYCTIAAHTMNHKTLNQLTDIELEYEVLRGKKNLEKKIGKQIKHFAYPFGTLNEIGTREVEFVQKCGFDTACFAFGGEVNRKNLNKLHELPRVFLGELYR